MRVQKLLNDDFKRRSEIHGHGIHRIYLSDDNNNDNDDDDDNESNEINLPLKQLLFPYPPPVVYLINEILFQDTILKYMVIIHHVIKQGIIKNGRGVWGSNSCG